MKTRDVFALIVAGSLSAAVAAQAPGGQPAAPAEKPAKAADKVPAAQPGLEAVDVLELRREVQVQAERLRADADRAARELPPPAGLPGDRIMLAGPEDRVFFAAAPVVMEKAAFLGVGVSPVAPALREQLKLPKYLGLVVDHVEEGSPAETAGIKQFDILEKIDDQLLANGQQLAALIRSRKNGDEVKISLIRQGERKTIPAKLTEREVAALDEAAPWGRPPAAWVDDGGRGGAVGAFSTQFERAVRVVGPEGHMAINVQPTGQQVMVLNDGKIKVQVTDADGKRTVTATDVPTGKKVFDGPVNTDAERKALPPDVAELMKQLKQIQTGGGTAVIEPFNVMVAPPARVSVPGAATMTYVDGDESYVISSRREGEARKLELTFKLKDTVIFEGPINTPEDKKALPKDVSQKLETYPLRAMLETLRFGGDRPTGNMRIRGQALPPGQPLPTPGR